MVHEITSKAQWDKTLAGAQGKIVVVDFTAAWCAMRVMGACYPAG
jgi:thiol:disulfide interchange protein